MSSAITSELTKNINLSQNSIETIDGALLDYVNSLNIFCNTSSGWNKVPIIWSSAERSYQIKNNPSLRDKNGTLIAPIISIERVSISKDPNKKGGFQANLSPKQDRYFSTKVLNQEKTSTFANNNALYKSGQVNFRTSKKNNKVVYQYMEVKIPVYITIQYKINILTNYQVQMNEIMQPFITRNAQNYFVINKDDYKFECFMEPEFSQDSVTNLAEEERKYKASIGIKVLGYLIGEDKNEEQRVVKTYENAVEYKFPRESLIIDGKERAPIRRIGPNFATDLSTFGKSNIKTFNIGDNINIDFSLAHSLNSKNLAVVVRENFGDFNIVNTFISFNTNNTITVHIDEAATANAYTVTVMEELLASPNKNNYVIGNGSDSLYTITHNLNTRNLYVSVRENFGDFNVITPGIEFTSLNTISLDMGDSINLNSYTVTIIKAVKAPLKSKSFTIGDTINSLYTLTHNYNTRNVLVSVIKNSPNYELVYPLVTTPDVNTITIEMGDIIGLNSYYVTIIG
jgi:hypothetical protein